MSPVLAKMDASLVGTRLPGIKQACARVCAAHDKTFVHYPHHTIVGWDAMIMKNNEYVFFEGNIGFARARQHMFFSTELLLEFVSQLGNREKKKMT